MAANPEIPEVFNPREFEDLDLDKNKFLRKAKDEPFVPIGIGLGLGVLAYQAYKFKNRGKLPVSVYLIHTRVLAQGTIIGVLTLGVLHSMYKEYFGKDKKAIASN